MNYQKEIIRGVRLAAIVFAALLVSLITYRTIHFTPAPAAPTQPAAQPAPEVVSTPESFVAPDAVPEAVPVPVKPQIHRHPHRSAAALAPANTVSSAEPVPAPAAAPTPAADPSAIASLVNAPFETSSPDANAAKAEDVAKPQSAADNPAPRPSRKKAFLRAVGRLFHVGSKKDAQDQAQQQQQ